MIELRRLVRGPKILVDRLNACMDAIDEVRNKPPGPGLGRLSDGTVYTLKRRQAPLGTGGGATGSNSPVAELCEAYSGSVIYRLGEHVMLDDLVYNCLTAGTVGESPDSSENWEVVQEDDVDVVGITSWPNTPLTAYKTRVRTNGRYNNTTHVLSTCYTVTTFNSLGAVIGMDAIVIETMTTAVPDVDE
jgi:hypothetical protein